MLCYQFLTAGPDVSCTVPAGPKADRTHTGRREILGGEAAQRDGGGPCSIPACSQPSGVDYLAAVAAGANSPPVLHLENR